MLHQARACPLTDNRPCVLLGAGGHAKVLLALIRALTLPIRGVCDPALAQQGICTWRGIEVLGDDTALARLSPQEVRLINCLGPILQVRTRERIFTTLRAQGYDFPALVHPQAWVSEEVFLGTGVQIMAGVIIQPDSHIGDNTVVNTGARIDHDCRIGAHVHIAPGATLCGGVKVEDRAFIGSGATIIQQVAIGVDSVVGAGTTVVRDLSDNTQVIGAPIRTNRLITEDL